MASSLCSGSGNQGAAPATKSSGQPAAGNTAFSSWGNGQVSAGNPGQPGTASDSNIDANSHWGLGKTVFGGVGQGDFGKTRTTIQPTYFDPLEGGGQMARLGVYGTLGNLWPQLGQNSTATANALQSGAAAPGWGQGQKLAQDTMAGNYLNGSPALDNAMSAMRAASAAEGANANSRARSTYAQNGMSFGTGSQEAEQNADAARLATANNAEAQARLSNYQSERTAQNNAINNYATATTTPINYLAQANEAYTQPLTEIAQMIKGLSGGGTVAQPDTMVNDSAMGNFTGAVGQL